MGQPRQTIWLRKGQGANHAKGGGSYLWVAFGPGKLRSYSGDIPVDSTDERHFIWSLGSSLAAELLATLNIVRAGRPDDKTLAVITAIGTACWALVAFGFGKSIGNVLDPRPLGHVIISRLGDLQHSHGLEEVW